MSILAYDQFSAIIINALDEEKTGVKFSIDFNEVWECAGYTRKEDALRFLTQRTSLQLGKHFSANRRKSPSGGRPSESLLISVDAFKFFLAKSNTVKGDEYLWYLIEIEKDQKQKLERQFNSVPAFDNLELIAKLEGQVKKLKAERDNYYDRLQTYESMERIDKKDNTFCRNFIDMFNQIPYGGNNSKNGMRYLFTNVMLEKLNLKENIDFIFTGEKQTKSGNTRYKFIQVTEQAYQAILTWGRPKNGMMASAETPRQFTVSRSFIKQHGTSKTNSANTFQVKD